MKPSARTLTFAFLVLGSATGAVASGGGGQTIQAYDRLAKARELQAARQWQAAIDELRRVNATGDPMWNNLMGYSLRRNDPPDFAAAETYYGAALAINPKHRPTLEYLGELRLQQGDLAGAEQQLDALKRASFFKSEEFKDLQEAIARYKAAGNKYVPKD
jgi:hypothetical protein